MWWLFLRAFWSYGKCNLILWSQAHTLQLEAFSVALKKLDADLPRPKLQFVGSCRNNSDEERLQNLKNKAIELKVDGDVEFYKNLMYRFVPVKYILDPLYIHIMLCGINGWICALTSPTHEYTFYIKKLIILSPKRILPIWTFLT